MSGFNVVEKQTGLMDGTYSSRESAEHLCQEMKDSYPNGEWTITEDIDGKEIPNSMCFGILTKEQLHARINSAKKED